VNFIKPSNNDDKGNSEEIEQIDTFIDYDFDMENKSDEKNNNCEESSEKINKPDYIQTIAMNLSQPNTKIITENAFTKRKNPYSVQRPNDEFTRQSNIFK